MKKKVVFILFFFTTSICLIYGFQKQEQLIEPEKHEVEVRLVLVDVIVTKDGKFVKDLTKDDFELYEDGKRVPINSFELISFEERELKIVEEKAEIKRPAPQKRKLTVIFDAINSWKRPIKIDSEKIIGELFSLIKLGHEVMILQLHKRKGLEIIQPFTVDENLIRKAVEKASGNIWKLEMDADEVPPKFVVDPERYRELTRLEYLYLERRRFQETVGGLLGAFNMIRNLPGRKSVLLIGAGIPDLPFRVIENIRVFDPFNILEKKNFQDDEEVMKELISFANAQNISIYTLDSDIYVKHLFSGSTAERYQKYELAPFIIREGDKKRKVQNLRWISKETGASHLRGADKFDNFRQVMSTDLKYYYQLSYYPQRQEADDKYHKINVSVKRRGMKTRFRKGYTDYSQEEASKIKLVTAFYNPSLCKQLPFEGEFIPFFTESGKYEPWMNIALPAQELFRDRFVEYARKKFNLHIWIVDKKTGEKGFGGQINLPFNINSSFMEFIKNIDYLSFHFKGPELTFKHDEYQAVFALVDPETNEIGTWESVVNLPDLKDSDSAAFINCVLGHIKENQEERPESFKLSKQDGCLEYASIKFFPKIINTFEQRNGARVFIQVYPPIGIKNISPDFMIKGAENMVQVIRQELIAKSFNKASRVWSGLFFLDLVPASIGENTLYVEIPGVEEGSILSRELKLTVTRATREDENNKFKSFFGAEVDENGNNSHNHNIFSECVSDMKVKSQPELEKILEKCAEYCEKLKSSALYFVCEEKIKEVIILKPRIDYPRLKVPAVTERNEYVYDYQLIKKGTDIKESRTLIEENGEKRDIKNAPLKTKRFYSLKSVYGPVGFFSKEFQELYNHNLKKEGKIKGRKAYVIEVIPKRKMEDKPNYGKLWVDKENFSVLKTEISQESLAGFEDLEKKAKNLRMKPILKTTHYYEVEKKGIRFPSKTVFEEVYISTAKRRERSRTVIEYDNYRFFIVDYEVKYK